MDKFGEFLNLYWENYKYIFCKICSAYYFVSSFIDYTNKDAYSRHYYFSV